MFVPVAPLRFLWPMRYFLVSSGRIGEDANIATVSFCMPVSNEPPLIAIALGKDTHSSGLIKLHKEFVVNIPHADLKKDILFCGFFSGRDVDKFSQTGFTPLPSESMDCIRIEQCLAWMECRLVDTVLTGDKLLFIGEVQAAFAANELSSGEISLDFPIGDYPSKIYGK